MHCYCVKGMSSEHVLLLCEGNVERRNLRQSGRFFAQCRTILTHTLGFFSALLSTMQPTVHSTRDLMSDYKGDQQCADGTYDCFPTIAEEFMASNPTTTVVEQGVRSSLTRCMLYTATTSSAGTSGRLVYRMLYTATSSAGASWETCLQWMVQVGVFF